MRPTSIKYARTPLIKFVGGKHVFSEVDTAVKPHASSGGLIPGGDGAIKVSSLPKRETPKPKAKPQSWGLKPSDKPYDFVSVLDLPKRFQTPVFDESEIDAVNGGGADFLVK